MRKTLVDIDENLFENVRRLFRTTSIEQSIDAALGEAVRDATHYHGILTPEATENQCDIAVRRDTRKFGCLRRWTASTWRKMR